ncbi:SusC/RagA family TonB-linked outer membrane protein [Flavobacterium aciduliphilum]|uniref:TonB-linked SusC/RagA family outer membrane protein n=1 Tax=Flavobacterium aciduliphilum TaxID=1101402 RepID=A0A328YIQ2_9FLAO|nr:TonB-dependent receptor [Flavobacterium aciduliphilum]RAR72933.1 TonB-linked SusC/RagA family outer membrane protein [Flavobacterium aciduliphilum]
MKCKLFFLLTFLLSISTYSQEFEISGKVSDAISGLPISGVNIVVKSSKISSQTDLDGNFKITKIPKGSKVIFSYIGYANFELIVNQSQNIIVNLKEDKNTLDEVVIVGYTSKKKKDVTGSVSVISTKTIEDLHPIVTAQALQGTVAGVVVNSGSGAPGSGFSINIRGVSSNTNNQPYYLIDGYEGDISLINPSDIETITVLKDAQASVYGSKGANGVVLVTTKLGKRNTKPKVSFNTYIGNQQTSKKLNLLNATEYAMLLNESYANNGQSIPYPNVTGLGKGTNWQDEVFKKAPILSKDISISGGSENIIYSFSASNINQEGIVGLSKSGFDRSNARLSLGVDFSKKINFSTTLNYMDYNRKSLNENGIGSVLFNAINTPSTISLYDANGNYSLVPDTPGYGNEVINPLAQIENTYNSYNQKKIFGNFVMQYKPCKSFKVTTRYGFNSGNDVGKSFSKEIYYGQSKVFNVNRSSVSQNATRFSDFTFDMFGEYENTFYDKHKVKVTIGGTLNESKGEGLYATGYDVPNNSWDFADIALTNGIPPEGVITNGSYKSTPYKRPSLFTTIDYDYKGKYLLTFIGRRDQSSRFSSKYSVAYFKSILLGWVLSNEDFFNKDLPINFLKLKASYGTLGNDVAPANAYRGLLTGEATYVFDNTLVNGIAAGQITNKVLKWETDTKLDFGLESKWFKNKFELTADYFNDTRSDLIISGVPISGINGGYAPGSGAPSVNAGTVRNTGFELSINYKNNVNKFKYELGFNITTINNKVLKVNNSTGFIESGSFGIGQLAPTRMEEGQPMGVFYGLKTDGIFQNQAEIDAAPVQNFGTPTVPGDIRYKDINGDGVVDIKDRTYIGKPIADYTLGFNVNLKYKGFDLVAYAYASVGNDLIRNYERTESKLNRLNYVLDRWTGEGTSNTVPRVSTGPSSNNLFSDYFVEDASFIRIQNLQLGYSLPSKLIEKAHISKFRFYGSVNNLLTFTKYRGYDPSANSGNPVSGGIDYGYYPAPKIYSLGLNVNF